MNEEVILNGDDIFPFDCSRKLGCFTNCCMGIDLFLTPYDILRLKAKLVTSSREFLDRYTHAVYAEQVGHPLVVMKMVGDQKRCPFSAPEGCLVYEDRPWSCRSFPLEPLIDRSSPSAQTYAVVKRPFCLGFNTDGKVTVKQWLEDQGTAVYEKINAIWSEVTLSKKFPDQGLDHTGIQMFFLASYSLDEFRELAIRPSFLENYGLKTEDLSPIIADDIMFFKFACRWLRVALLKEQIALMAGS